MIVEIKESIEWGKYFWHSIGVSIAIFVVLVGTFCVTNYFVPNDPDMLRALSWCFSGVGLFCFVLSGFIIMGLTLFKFESKTFCLVCGKKDYPRNMVVLNKKKSGEGEYARCVCKCHKRPYMRLVKNDWDKINGRIE